MKSVEVLTYIPGTDDPKKIILDKLGSELDKFPTIYGSRILVATAPSPDRKGLILLTDKAKDEGRWQGKVGLVLKLGETAAECDPRYPSYEWKGPKPEVGKFVFFRTSDGFEVAINGISCRVIWDSDVIGEITDIESIY